MTSQLKAKLLQHFAGKKANGGFTLIELLVVIIIIGILSAIALPSFLNQANKAKQSEAKAYVGSSNRAQQAYYMENGNFVEETDDFGRLGLGVEIDTANYNYQLTAQDDGVITQGIPDGGTSAALKAYAGAVKVGTIGSGSATEATTLAVLCEAELAPIAEGAAGDEAFENMEATDEGAPDCPTSEDYKELGA